mgnify:CR=1 FL=1
MYYNLKQNSFIFQNKKPPYKKVCFGIRGQYGDIIMQEPALREFIRNNPDTKIVIGAYKKYQDIFPLFYNYHENIIGYKAFDGYNDWPTKADKEYIKKEGFDAIFPNGIPIHQQPDWANYKHITVETALMIGLSARSSNIELYMPDDVKKEPKTACIHMFSSKYPGGARSVGIEKQTAITKHLLKNGYKVYQLSAPHQPHIEGAIFNKGTYYDACIRMLSADFLVSCDSGMPWVASAYNHPMLGLFSTAYNDLVTTTKNWQPINPNAIYLESPYANAISIDSIIKEINNLIRNTK